MGLIAHSFEMLEPQKKTKSLFPCLNFGNVMFCIFYSTESYKNLVQKSYG